jgi:peptide/nickel transport system permease protein
MEQQQAHAQRLKNRPAADRSVGLWEQALRRFLRHRAGVVAGVVFLLIVAIVALGPTFLVSHDAAFRPMPLEINQPPSLEHPLGTDEVGRDILARLIYGGQISLTVGVLAMVVSITLGVLLGALSGYFGGVVDSIIMRLTDVMMSVPSIFLMIAFAVFFGPAVRTIILAIGLLNWMSVARIVRSSFLSLKEQEFVTAARCIGARNGRIIWLHILPNAVAPVVVAATLTIGAAILTETSVSYLGMGIQPPTPSWGNMLKNAQDVIWKAPWVAMFPGMMIFVTTLCINFAGDALRDALDPRMKL